MSWHLEIGREVRWGRLRQITYYIKFWESNFTFKWNRSDKNDLVTEMYFPTFHIPLKINILV